MLNSRCVEAAVEIWGISAHPQRENLWRARPPALSFWAIEILPILTMPRVVCSPLAVVSGKASVRPRPRRAKVAGPVIFVCKFSCHGAMAGKSGLKRELPLTRRCWELARPPRLRLATVPAQSARFLTNRIALWCSCTSGFITLRRFTNLPGRGFRRPPLARVWSEVCDRVCSYSFPVTSLGVILSPLMICFDSAFDVGPHRSRAEARIRFSDRSRACAPARQGEAFLEDLSRSGIFKYGTAISVSIPVRPLIPPRCFAHPVTEQPRLQEIHPVLVQMPFALTRRSHIVCCQILAGSWLLPDRSLARELAGTLQKSSTAILRPDRFE